jgi:PEP-CTERM motif
VNTLRIMSLACGASRIKQLIGLLTLLLLWPALASADCLPSQACLVTSGTPFEVPADSITLNFSGQGFSASGVLTVVGNLPITQIFLPGSSFDEFFGGTDSENLLQLKLTVNGVPWGIPAGGDAGVAFGARLGIPGGSAPFSFEGFFKGAPEPFPPGLGCDVLNCVDLEFRGGGIVDYGVSESLDAPGWFTVGGQTFTFAAVPEPATLSLFAVGLLGLAIRRKQSPRSTRHSRLRL